VIQKPEKVQRPEQHAFAEQKFSREVSRQSQLSSNLVVLGIIQNNPYALSFESKACQSAAPKWCLAAKSCLRVGLFQQVPDPVQLRCLLQLVLSNRFQTTGLFQRRNQLPSANIAGCFGRGGLCKDNIRLCKAETVGGNKLCRCAVLV
jgi:hypothetical protein